MNRLRFVSQFVVLGLALVQIPAMAATESNGCVSCHQKASFFADYPKLHEYYQQWLASPHEQAGVSCDDCHGGNSKATTAQKAHSGVLPMSNKRSTLHYQRQPETCGQCHGRKERQFVRSKHYAALMDQRSAPTCTTCHAAMSRRPELRTIVLNACRNCHGEGNSENLPLIADQAEHVFNQLNVAGGLLGWTRIHYESHGWPDDSEARIKGLDIRYQSIIDRVHQFDLQQTEDATIEMIGELRGIFDAARRAHEQRPGDS